MERPPFEITDTSLSLTGELLRLVGRYEGIAGLAPQPTLRRKNRIRTVKATVAIEGNTLSVEQVTALLDGKRVVGPGDEILEVKNTIAAYENAANFRASAKRDLLRAHRQLMSGVLGDAGRFRKGSVGVVAGSRVRHVAPPADRVPHLVSNLLAFEKGAREVHPLVRAAVLHYELAFIHPFSDGNGRTARFWQHVALRAYAPVFEFVPTESIIEARQQDYYRVLEACDKAGNSTAFVEFSLAVTHDALSELVEELRPTQFAGTDRLALASAHFKREHFSRKDYLALFKTISAATASRDLRRGYDSGLLARTGDKALARYRFR